ncbi:MAG: VWA domain-containing protein [Planctomycetes bacterium]|nr:VWA domain-containing protein [Planctomycetota bacterium]
MTDTYGFYLGQPWWLVVGLVIVPMIWLARRNLAALGTGRRTMALVLRVLAVLILVVLLARPMLVKESRRATVIAVVDRSQSIPAPLGEAALDYLSHAVAVGRGVNQLAVVDVAETASISKLPSGDTTLRRRNTMLTGQQSRLASGIEMALAIAPPDTAMRIVLLSEGNETQGDLKEAARTAAANGIPIDVLPLEYRYESEVLFKRLAAPLRARSGQTISLRFVLNSTAAVRGKLLLTLNGEPVDLIPEGPEVAAPVELTEGTNVKTISLPVGTRGIHNFQAVFLPDDPQQDRIAENNRASAMTYVAGPGHILVVDADDTSARSLLQALRATDMAVRYLPASALPDDLALLIDTDAIVLANVDCGSLTFAHQEMLCRYVKDLGGGLIMTGGPNAFGAGGWIGSPVAEILPVDLDPPQKKQLPKGALVLIMHACEMPQGNYWGKKVAMAAVGTLSRLDLVGILSYNWSRTGDWVYDLQPVGDRDKVVGAIEQMQMGDMPSLHDHLQMAHDALVRCDAGQKHVIVITDGDPTPPSQQLLTQLSDARITCTGVCIFPHTPGSKVNLQQMAVATGGRYYDVTDPATLPQIFIKEAQVVRRSLILEEPFTPQVTFGLSEILRGVALPLPTLNGHVLTGPKGGLNQLVLATHQADPLLATCQAGLGRCVAFTSSADSRWAGPWLQWGDFARFWEQVVRWAGRPAQSTECEIATDTQGQEATVRVEALDAQGKSLDLAAVEGQVLTPEMKSEPLQLAQTGPGQYAGRFKVSASGSYIVNLRYRKAGPEGASGLANAIVTVPFAPEFRDLSDNAPLLREVSRITGGRVLSLVSDPNDVNLYDYAGLKFPQTYLPLLRPLMLAWLAVFLLDVAVRRVAVDVRAALRRARAWLTRTARQEQDQVISRLQARRQKLREQWSTRQAEAASRHYEGAQEYEGQLLSAEPTHREEPPKPEMKEPEKPKKPPQTTHIDQLLQARRKKTAHEDKGGANE